MKRAGHDDDPEASDDNNCIDLLGLRLAGTGVRPLRRLERVFQAMQRRDRGFQSLCRRGLRTRFANGDRPRDHVREYTENDTFFGMY
jgi:hypothetical protein